MPSSLFLYKRDQLGQLVQTEKTRQRRNSKPLRIRKRGRRYENASKDIISLDELDRTLLDSRIKTPEEAHKKLGILLMEAEARMMRSIPAKFGVETLSEARRIFKKELATT